MAQPVEAMGGRSRRRIGIAVAAAFASLLVPLVIGGTDALRAAIGFPVRAYPLILGAVGASWLCRALKMQLLLERLRLRPGFAATLAVSLATEFGFAATPAGIGGYAASIYYLRRVGATSSGAAMLTAADQVLDLIFFALALPLAAAAMPAATTPLGVSDLLRWTSTAMFGGLCVAWLARRPLQRWASNADDDAPHGARGLGNRARRFLLRLGTDAAVVVRGGPLFLAMLFCLSTLQWIARYGVLWLVLAALGEPTSFATVFLLQAFVLHAAQWTGLPAGAGVVELGIGAALLTSMPTVDLAAGLLVWRAATVYAILAAGALAIVWLARRPVADAASPATAW